MLGAEQCVSHSLPGDSVVADKLEPFAMAGQSQGRAATLGSAQGQAGKGAGVSLGFFASSKGPTIRLPSSFAIGPEAAAGLQRPHQVHGDSRSFAPS